MAIEGGFGNRFPIVFRKEPVEAIVAAAGLFFFEFDGLALDILMSRACQ